MNKTIIPQSSRYVDEILLLYYLDFFIKNGQIEVINLKKRIFDE
jgi:hypothetical protein